MVVSVFENDCLLSMCFNVEGEMAKVLASSLISIPLEIAFLAAVRYFSLFSP